MKEHRVNENRKRASKWGEITEHSYSTTIHKKREMRRSGIGKTKLKCSPGRERERERGREGGREKAIDCPTVLFILSLHCDSSLSLPFLHEHFRLTLSEDE